MVDARHFGFRLGKLIEANHVLVEPLTVGMRRGHRLLQLLVGDDASFFGIDQEHSARFQARLLEDAIRLDWQDADLRRHHHYVVLGDAVARGAQAVAVQHGAYDFAISKDHGGRSVPGFHHRTVVFVKRLFGVAHGFMLRPRLRDHHHHCVGQ